MNSTHTIWTEKYRPDTLDGFVGNESIKSKVTKFLESGDIPHLLFSGPAGTGKTTLAKMIVNTIPCDYKYINASDENNIETVRTKIKSFASTVGFSDKKIVILDEADYITPNAQAALRNIMETFSKHTRFILTCNFVERIIDPIVSRTQQFTVVPPTHKDVALHVAKILKSENVDFTLEDVKLIIDAHYPDIRKIINELQLHSSSGTLVIDRSEIVHSDAKLQLIDILGDKSKDAKTKFQEIRQILVDSNMRDFSDVYRLLYDKVDDYAKGHVGQTILHIAEGQRWDSLVVDKEINMCSTLINILQTIGRN